MYLFVFLSCLFSSLFLTCILPIYHFLSPLSYSASFLSSHYVPNLLFLMLHYYYIPYLLLIIYLIFVYLLHVN